MRSNTHLFILMIGLSLIFQAQGQTSPLEDPALNPWITPLDQCDKNGNHNKLDINMGFLNTDYFCKIDPEKGAIFLTKNRQPTKSWRGGGSRLDSSPILLQRQQSTSDYLGIKI